MSLDMLMVIAMLCQSPSIDVQKDCQREYVQCVVKNPIVDKSFKSETYTDALASCVIQAEIKQR